MIGTVTTYFAAREFGFITCDGEKTTRFFHKSHFIEGEPKLGARVDFELGDANKLGMPQQCVNITVVDAQEASAKAGV